MCGFFKGVNGLKGTESNPVSPCDRSALLYIHVLYTPRHWRTRRPLPPPHAHMALSPCSPCRSTHRSPLVPRFSWTTTRRTSDRLTQTTRPTPQPRRSLARLACTEIATLPRWSVRPAVACVNPLCISAPLSLTLSISLLRPMPTVPRLLVWDLSPSNRRFTRP